MKFTPAQCRKAFYQAAANIEARPELYDFWAIKVGEDDCPACMWGHVGRSLGMTKETGSWDSLGGNVAEVLGFHAYDIMPSAHPASADLPACFHKLPSAAARAVRAFADHHWPAESTKPVRTDLKECGMSFSELLQNINGEIA